MQSIRPYLNLLDNCFPGLKSNILRCEKIGYPWASKPFLKKKDGEIASHVGFIDYPMLIEGKLYKVGALHAVCTKNEYRKQGLASDLISEVLLWSKGNYDFLILYTDIPEFYEKLSFKYIQEYRFKLTYQHKKGQFKLQELNAHKDNALFLKTFQDRCSVSKRLWVKDNGFIASFNTLFATYPTYWSLHYSPSLNAIISFELKGKVLHLYDIVASQLPSLDQILEHIPSEVDEIYFYFSPDLLTNEAIPEGYIFDNGYFMVHGNAPIFKPFMISPLSRC